MPPSRREFLKSAAATAAMAALPTARAAAPAAGALDARRFLEQLLYTRKEVEDWLALLAFPFAKYDAELGWLLRPGRVADGVDGSISTYSFGKFDERKTIQYADQPCRINTYGNSFTQCHQVSDGETWQEVLAAHIGEPVRNFGVGGWSTYQAYLRMLREEKRAPAEFLVVNIYDDDHYRNLDSWRSIRARKHARFIEPTLPHLVVDVEHGTCEKRPNPCPTPESVYHLCDLDWVVEQFKNDFALRIMLAHSNAKQENPEAAYQDLQALATTHGINTRVDESPTVSAAAEALHTRAALFSNTRVVEWIEEYAKQHKKRVLYVLSYPAGSVARWLKEGTRVDQPFVDFLNEKQLPWIDLLAAHAADYAKYKTSVQDYCKQYFIGHYNPRGNLFQAFAIKDKLVELLEPKPGAYREP